MPNKSLLASAPCAVEINPPPIIIMISKLDAVFVLSPKPAIPSVKIHGQRVLQNNPTEIKAKTLIIPEEKIPTIKAPIPKVE